MQNSDVKAARFRDFSQLAKQSYATNIQEFNSVDETFFFMENMFAEAFDEKHIGIALDVFLRDIAEFTEKDLESPTMKMFLR